MAIEHDLLPFLEWLLPVVGVRLGALGTFAIAVVCLILAGILVSYVIAALRHGPTEAFYVVAKVIAVAVGQDLPNFSFRRTMAMARLAIQEAIRRKVLIGFAVFLVLLLFAGWFLDVKSDHPARLYLGFVLTTAQYMMFLVALFLSTFSLPNDIKNKTIYTVVTKPVRAGEIVLGRIIGFSVIGTGLLVVMALASYVFVVRGLAHSHQINPEEMEKLATEGSGASLAAKGRTSRDSHHRHEVTIGPDGRGQTNTQTGHWHEATYDANTKSHHVGDHQGMLQARVPQYGRLKFIDRQGRDDPKGAKGGISVGKEWGYRGYLEGETQAAAVWTFSGVTASDYRDGLPIELNMSVFRTHKGDIEKGIRGEIVVFNASGKGKIRRSEPIPFIAVEFAPFEKTLPRKLKGLNLQNQLQDIDLFDDLAADGRLEIRIRCRQGGQYFGVAQADLYLKRANQRFDLNFMKAYTSVWLQLIMVTGFGVMFSTLLSAPVSLLASISSIVLGFFGSFISVISKGQYGVPSDTMPTEAVEGGGPIESFIRLWTQANLSVELELGTAEKVIKFIDWCVLSVTGVFTRLLPNYEDFNTANYLSNGFNIPFDEVLSKHLVMAVASSVIVSVIGYFCLKTREIGA